MFCLRPMATTANLSVSRKQRGGELRLARRTLETAVEGPERPAAKAVMTGVYEGHQSGVGCGSAQTQSRPFRPAERVQVSVGKQSRAEGPLRPS